REKGARRIAASGPPRQWSGVLLRQGKPPPLLARRHIPLAHRLIAADREQRLAAGQKRYEDRAIAMPPAHRPQAGDRAGRQRVAVRIDLRRLLGTDRGDESQERENRNEPRESVPAHDVPSCRGGGPSFWLCCVSLLCVFLRNLRLI